VAREWRRNGARCWASGSKLGIRNSKFGIWLTSFEFRFSSFRFSPAPSTQHLFSLGCAFFLTGETPRFYKKKSGALRDQAVAGATGKRFNLVRRGYHTNKSHCPETRRRANGWSWQGRLKALSKVAVAGSKTLRCVEPKLSPGGLSRRGSFNPVCMDRPCGAFAPGGVLLLVHFLWSE
jgi:hypothetical protein